MISIALGGLLVRLNSRQSIGGHSPHLFQADTHIS